MHDHQQPLLHHSLPQDHLQLHSLHFPHPHHSQHEHEVLGEVVSVSLFSVKLLEYIKNHVANVQISNVIQKIMFFMIV